MATPGHSARHGVIGAALPRPALLWWAAGAVLFGVLLGAAAGADQAMLAVGLVLVPAMVALALRPDWLPPVLIVSVFGEAIVVGGLPISRLMGPVALAILLLHLATRRTRMAPFPHPWILVAAAAFAAWAFASAMWSLNPDPSMSEGGTGYALASLALAAIYLAVFAVLVRTEEQVRRVLVAIWAMGVLMGAIAIVAYLSGSGRSVGASGDPNFFASLQVFAVPVGAVLATQARSATARLVVLVGLVVIVGSVVTSLSRGGLLALAAVVLLLAAQPARAFFQTKARKRLFLLAVGAGVAVLTIAAYGALSQRTDSLFTTADGGSGRANIWEAALLAWEEHPVAGLGFGAFESQSNYYLRRAPGANFTAYKLRAGGQVVHSAYLGALVELGVIGLGLFLALLASLLATLLATARRAAATAQPYLAAVARALILSLAAFAFASIFLSTQTDRTLWVLLGIALALSRVVADRAQTDHPSTEPPTHD